MYYSRGLAEWMPKPFWKRKGIQLMAIFLLQLIFLTLFLLSVCVPQNVDAGDNPTSSNTEQLMVQKCEGEIGNAICEEYKEKIKQIMDANANDNIQMRDLKADNFGQIESDHANKPDQTYSFCRESKKCAQQIMRSEPMPIDFTVCFASELPRNEKMGLRFQLHFDQNNHYKALCADCSQCKANFTQWNGMRLYNKGADIMIEATFFESPLKVKGLNISEEFLVKLFNAVSSQKNCEQDIYRGVKVLNKMENQTLYGAFTSDLLSQLEILQFVLIQALQRSILLNTTTINPTKVKKESDKVFWYKISERESADLKTDEEILDECRADIERWNKEKGYEEYQLDEYSCLMSGRNKGIDLNTIPDRPDVYWTERYDGLKEPPPIDPKAPEPKWTSVEKVDPKKLKKYLPKEWFSNPKPKLKRAKRQTEIEYDIECTRKEFDIRKKNEQCQEITSYIRWQGKCGNCWAVSTASALTDRACILVSKNRKGKLTKKANLHRVASARDLMECALPRVKNCEGAWPSQAWEYIVKKGTVNEKCKPYPVDNENFNKSIDWTKKCIERCDVKTEDNGSLDLIRWGGSFDNISWHVINPGGGWNIIKGFSATLYQAESMIVIKDKTGPEWEQMLMKEIETNGSIIAVYTLYDDFRGHNPDEVYRHKEEAVPTEFAHAVRIIGFGQEECTGGPVTDSEYKVVAVKYWIVANSWGSQWKKDGTFRIVRGEDESGIESTEISWGNLIFLYGKNDKLGNPSKSGT